MIKVTRNEYREGHLAVRVWKITFFNIPIFKARLTSTNIQAVQQLTVVENNGVSVRGFTN